MIKFTLYKNKLSVDEDSLNTPELIHLWEKDKSKAKDIGLKALLFVFFMEELSENNPLSQIPFYNKLRSSLYRAFGSENFNIEKELSASWLKAINDARVSYRKNVPDTLKDIATFDRKMDELRIMLNETVPVIKKNTHDNSGKVSFSTNTAIINKALTSIIAIIQSKASLMAVHIQGTVPKHLRGGLSPLSKGKIKTKKI